VDIISGTEKAEMFCGKKLELEDLPAMTQCASLSNDCACTEGKAIYFGRKTGTGID
jgi:hypothetical protein